MRRISSRGPHAKCRSSMWRCPSDKDCYALLGKDTLLRVECYGRHGEKCTSEVIIGRRRPWAQRKTTRSMRAGQQWACDRATGR